MAVRSLFFVDVPHRFTGAQRSLLAALERLPALGIDPLVVFPSEGMCVDAYRASGLDVRVALAPASLLTFGKKHLGISTFAKTNLLFQDVLPYARVLTSLMQNEGVQVVHFNAPRGILIGGFAVKMMGLRCVLHHRGFMPFRGSYWLAAQALADRIILVSRAMSADLYRPIRPRMRVVYNGVEIPPVTTSKAVARRRVVERLGIPLADDEVLFLSLSSPLVFKGLHHLVTAAASARAQGLKARYVCAGAGADPPYERWLVKRRADLGVEDIVHVIGYVTDPLELLAGADALVLPTVENEFLYYSGRALQVVGTEGFPRSILEAMAMGIPTIASRVGGVVEQVVPGVTGELIPPSDPDALANALLRVGNDPAWREAAGEQARDRAAALFSLDAAAKGLAEVLIEVARPAAAPERVAA